MLVHGDFDHVALEGLQNGFAIFRRSVPKRLQGDFRSLVRVKHVDECVTRVLDDFLPCFRFPKETGETEELQSRLLNDDRRKGFLLHVTQHFGLRDRVIGETG